MMDRHATMKLDNRRGTHPTPVIRSPDFLLSLTTMPDLTAADLANILRSGAARVKENHELLSRLDAATGDGDHGVTMKRVADVIICSRSRTANRWALARCWSRSAGT